MNNFSRRHFLKAAAAGATVFNIVPASVLGQNAPSNRIVVGAIGVGSQGRGVMGGFMQHADVVVKACCDVNTVKMVEFKKRVDERYGNSDCLMIKDFRELCDRKDIDAVMVATPDHWHATVGIYAANHGKDIYGEKPFTHNLREGRLYVNALEKNTRVFQAGSMQRSGGDFRRAVELVRNGRIGKVVRIEVGLPSGGRGKPGVPGTPVPEGLDWNMWVGPAPYREFQGVYDWDWRWILDFGGGQMKDWICHHCDIGLWAVQKDNVGPAEVEGVGLFKADGIYDSPTAYRYTAKYADGLEVVVADSNHFELGGGVRWIGEKGDWVFVTRGHFETSNPKLWYQQPEAGEFRLPSVSSQQRDFLDAVKARSVPTSPAEASHRVTSVGHLGQIAILTGRKIRWDWKAEEIIDDPAAASLLWREPRTEWAKA